MATHCWFASAPIGRGGVRLACAFLGLLALSSIVPQANAVPAFARQTHAPCIACHVGGFGPQLTAFGRQFKLLGYTLKAGRETNVPLSLMLVETYTHTRARQSAPPAKYFGTNDNTELQQASVFLAGRITDHLGVMAQATYSENGGLLGWDNSDLRYARSTTVGGHAAVWGISLNNNPSVTDLFNTAPAWQFPYMASNLTPGAPATPILMGGLAGQVVGLDAYAQIDGSLYLEVGGYRSLSPAFLRDVNASYSGRLSGVAPYLRLAYTWNLANGSAHVGAFAFHAARGLPGTNARGDAVALPGPTDKFTDLGIDAGYQLLPGNKHIVTINALYLAERQRLRATHDAGGSSNVGNTLRTANVNASYWYENTWGITLAGFADNGSRDPELYGNNGRPDTRGGEIELDWNPFGKADSWQQPSANLRIGLQYVWYTRFSGMVSNVDGAGRHAADNDTLFLYAWVTF